MHAGIPIIVSDNLTYLAELVTINKLGWVVCPGGLKTKIESLKRIEIDELKEAIQKFSKNTIWENDAVNFNNVYKSS